MSRPVMRVQTNDLEGNLAKGFHNFDITNCRIISSNAIQNTTEGGVPDGNTAPTLARVNAGTDKQLRLTWVAGSQAEVQFAPFQLPPDLDKAAPINVYLRAGKDANANSVNIDVQAFFNTGDTECGGATANIAQAVAEYGVELAAADVPDTGGVLNIALVPGAHAGDALFIESAWLVYTRKS